MKTVFIQQYVKASAIALVIFLSCTLLQAQDIVGQWKGNLNVPEESLRVVLNIYKTDDGYQSTVDSPDEGEIGIPMTITFDGLKLSLRHPEIGTLFNGEFKTDSIVGNITPPNGMSFPLTLKRAQIEVKPAVNSQ